MFDNDIKCKENNCKEKSTNYQDGKYFCSKHGLKYYLTMQQYNVNNNKNKQKKGYTL